jgi:hypothetical protein
MVFFDKVAFCPFNRHFAVSIVVGADRGDHPGSGLNRRESGMDDHGHGPKRPAAQL